MIEDSGHILPLIQVQKLVEKLGTRIDAPAAVLPTFGSSEDFARPHVEGGWAYHWVVMERGEEAQRRSTTSLDQLLYWVFEAVTSEMSTAWAAKNHRAQGDFRRSMFSKQIELLASLDPNWALRYRARIDDILREYPYSDE